MRHSSEGDKFIKYACYQSAILDEPLVTELNYFSMYAIPKIVLNNPNNNRVTLIKSDQIKKVSKNVRFRR